MIQDKLLENKSPEKECKEQNQGTLKVRFAPSPTGYLHVGGARTALFNYLYARKNGGALLLRIEDTDLKREIEGSINRIIEDMQWLGLKWDEGPIRQTGRLDIYRKYANALEDKGLTYPCYCTPEELKTNREKMMEAGTTPHYNGACRDLTPQQREQKSAEGRKPCIRFRMPDKSVVVKDLIRGDVVFEKDFVDDFIIMKSDNTPSYNFAVVVDDHEMGVTLVMRGEEHLVNTPRQISLYEALEFSMPQFAHISMILSPDRKKMSKRHGTVAVDIFRKEGYLPSALINYISLLGWSPPDNREFFTLDEMVEAFSLDRIAKNPAVYDIEKLRWMNSQYIKEMDNEKLLDMLIPFMKDAGFVDDDKTPENRDKLLLIVDALKSRLVLLSDIKEEASIFFDDNLELDEGAKESLEWDTTPAVFKAFLEVLDEYDAITSENSREFVKKIQKKSMTKGKKLYMPLRVGITGKGHGPEMVAVLTILSIEQMKKRLKSIIEICK
ncbi:MAG: glutamate--tRNA ligase [Candidatus Eremiobacteraeota bacterium]|nr:glutamate--tRNA ligase [Candidatus Eremiobacteraeota bacterium]